VPSVYLVNLPGDAGSSTGALSGDIRYCISQANNDAGSTVTFDTQATGSTITLSQGELPIWASMTLTGAGMVLIEATQAGDAQYYPALPVDQSFTVNKAAAAITLSGLNYAYDGSPHFATVTTTPPGLEGVMVTYTQAGVPVAAPTAAGGYQVVATLNNPNYQAADASATLVIAAPAPATVAVFDPTSATWYIRYSNSPGAPDIKPFAYGGAGWKPVVGDWDGHGTTTIGVVDVTGASNPNFAVWYLKNSNSPGAPDMAPFVYGMRSWIPIVGDWTGSGYTGIGAFDPSSAMWYQRNSAGTGATDFTPFAYGGVGWQPVPGNYSPLQALQVVPGGAAKSARNPLSDADAQSEIAIDAAKTEAEARGRSVEDES
jgi:hypothetical protein